MTPNILNGNNISMDNSYLFENFIPTTDDNMDNTISTLKYAPAPVTPTCSSSFSFMTAEKFESLIKEYIAGLHVRKRDKALITQQLANDCLLVLTNPENTNIFNPKFRWWVRKHFVFTVVGHHDGATNEGSSSSRILLDKKSNKPVCVKEQMYERVCYYHHIIGHGGRDKTFAAITKSYSKVPAELISLFTKNCQICHGVRKYSKNKRPVLQENEDMMTAVLPPQPPQPQQAQQHQQVHPLGLTIDTTITAYDASSSLFDSSDSPSPTPSSGPITPLFPIEFNPYASSTSGFYDASSYAQQQPQHHHHQQQNYSAQLQEMSLDFMNNNNTCTGFSHLEPIASVGVHSYDSSCDSNNNNNNNNNATATLNELAMYASEQYAQQQYHHHQQQHQQQQHYYKQEEHQPEQTGLDFSPYQLQQQQQQQQQQHPYDGQYYSQQDQSYYPPQHYDNQYQY